MSPLSLSELSSSSPYKEKVGVSLEEQNYVDRCTLELVDGISRSQDWERLRDLAFFVFRLEYLLPGIYI